MKLFTGPQIRACDKYTIEEEGLLSINLMEKAAQGIFEIFQTKITKSTPIYLLCGMGNNGGDGLALARLLIEHGYQAHAIVLNYQEEFSKDTYINLQRLRQTDKDAITELSAPQMPNIVEKNAIIIDAIFGNGLNRAIDGWVAQVIKYVNLLPANKISIDIPSGLQADFLPNVDDVIFQAAQTYTIQFLKRSFLHPETLPYTGVVSIVPIGLSQDFIDFENSNYYILDKSWAHKVLKLRNQNSNKGDFGKVAIIAGSYGKIGAALLATKGALRGGAGLVYTLAPKCGYEILQIGAPEAMFVESGEQVLEKINIPNNEATIGIGPGIGLDNDSLISFAQVLEWAQNPIVIDADALNMLAAHSELWERVPENSILTPHPKEFERMFGRSSSTLNRTEAALQRAIKHKVIIVLKGHHTTICTPTGNCFYNNNGNAGMATGGAGDVLTGLITALLAQGYSPEYAACLGVYLHGLAGDMAAKDKSEMSLIAGDIIDYFGKAILATLA